MLAKVVQNDGLFSRMGSIPKRIWLAKRFVQQHERRSRRREQTSIEELGVANKLYIVLLFTLPRVLSHIPGSGGLKSLPSVRPIAPRPAHAHLPRKPHRRTEDRNGTGRDGLPVPLDRSDLGTIQCGFRRSKSCRSRKKH